MYFFVLGILALSHTIRYSRGEAVNKTGVSEAAPLPCSSWGVVPWWCDPFLEEPKSRVPATQCPAQHHWESSWRYRWPHHGTRPAHPELLLWLGTVLAALCRGCSLVPVLLKQQLELTVTSPASHPDAWQEVLKAQAVTVTETVKLVSCFLSSRAEGSHCFPSAGAGQRLCLCSWFHTRAMWGWPSQF